METEGVFRCGDGDRGSVRGVQGVETETEGREDMVPEKTDEMPFIIPAWPQTRREWRWRGSGEKSCVSRFYFSEQCVGSWGVRPRAYIRV